LLLGDLDADVFAMTCFTPNRRGVNLVARLIREYHSEAHVVVGRTGQPNRYGSVKLTGRDRVSSVPRAKTEKLQKNLLWLNPYCIMYRMHKMHKMQENCQSFEFSLRFI